MYVYVVEYLGSRVAFKTCDDAERYVELMWGDKDNGVRPEIYPCLMMGDMR